MKQQLPREAFTSFDSDRLARVIFHALREPGAPTWPLDAFGVFSSLVQPPPPTGGVTVTQYGPADREAEVKRVEEALALLVWKGLVIVAGTKTYSHQTVLTFRLSPLGKSLGTDELDVAVLSAQTFLASYADAKKWDEVVQFFYCQALEANDRQLPVAAQFLLGAACERAILLLGETLSGRTMSSESSKRFERERNIQPKTEILIDAVKALEKAHPAERWLSELGSTLGSLANVYRRGRNEVGHPKIVPELDTKILRAYLAAFPSFMRDVQRTIALVGAA